jgi:F0F1-type ATP synthase membrane subunit b/b'
MSHLFPAAVNFVCFVALIYFAVRKNVKAGVSERHQSIKEELEKVQKQLKESEQKFYGYQEKIKNMSSEIAALRADIKQEADAVKTKVLSESKKLAENIVSDSKQSALNSVEEFKGQLKSELAAEVMNRAETILKSKMTDELKAKYGDLSRKEILSETQKETPRGQA